ncbi:MAG: STM4011 family radical SAM protein [Polyangiales bacterium]
MISLLYRGPLESCNYGCTYCPFAKKVDDRSTLRRDREALTRFVDRIGQLRDERFAIFFTPWGEAAIRSWYRRAMNDLAEMEHVERVAIQTNLSGPIDDFSAGKTAIWATYHPEWTSRARFVAKVRALVERGVRVSCGVVGFRRFGGEAEALRRELLESVYLWINAVKSTPAREPYDREDFERFLRVDPLFSVNARDHESAGHACRAGESVFSVDGDGTMRRCHFVRDVIGNFHRDDWRASLVERACPNTTCGCHIGYVHLKRLGLDDAFGEGILERIPSRSLPILQTIAARVSDYSPTAT